MLSKAEIEAAIMDLKEGEPEEALRILESLLDEGDYFDDICDCDFDAKDNCESCTCGAAQFLIGFVEKSDSEV